MLRSGSSWRDRAQRRSPGTADKAVAQYLAMYEMDTADTSAVMKQLNQAVGELAQRGRMFDGLQLVSSATYVALGERQTAGA